MSFTARAYRVLIASPSDVSRERELAVQAIQEWNDANSADRQVVLLPVRWETHAAPEYGKRPQAVINQQVGDGADAVVGIFWTKLGSPTGEADSGTVEEIERADEAGKLVMLYFSSAPQDPDQIDIEQLARLRAFKGKVWSKALVAPYSDVADFKEKFLKQLDIHARTLFLAEESSGDQPLPVTDIELAFGDPDTLEQSAETLILNTKHLNVIDIQNVPDYVPEEGEQSKTSLWSKTPNKDYFRQVTTKLVLNAFFSPICWWLRNRGGIGARDVYVDLRISTEEDVLVVRNESDVPQSDPQKFNSGGLLGIGNHVSNPSALIRPARSWQTSIELRALQPQREICEQPKLIIGATKSCVVRVAAIIYADTLARPARKELILHLNVEEIECTAEMVISGFSVVEQKKRRRRRPAAA